MLNYLKTPAASRRDTLRVAAGGFGMLALQGLAAKPAAADTTTEGSLSTKPPHFAPRAKNVIFLCMGGGPSHVDTFDYKPTLNKRNGESSPVGRNRRGNGQLLGSPWKFNRHGDSGLWISELFPNLATRADDLCLLHGMQTDVPAHPQAFLALHTGSSQFVRPSLGAWTVYGLGTENANLPGFVSLNPPTSQGGPQNYGSSFLPAITQGTPIGRGRGRRGGSLTVENIKNERYATPAQRRQLDFVQKLNAAKLQRDVDNDPVEGMIESYELAFRMQADLPEVLDLNNESAATRNAYGIDDSETEGFGRQCLVARRLVEAGVRFVEVTAGGWDQHFNLTQALADNCRSIDKPIAGLLADLKKRGLLDDTLVIWTGEFGRTPYAQGDDGRDHNNKGFTSWMAGGGVKGGFSYGATDEFGYEAVEGKVHTHDFHATILHLLGLDHEGLTYEYAGRDFRLTDVHGRVVEEILA